jgi:D-glycero-D-manno-heptose 1,7-bisphosphate phosphatase
MVTDHRYYSVGALHRLPLTEAFFRRTPTILVDRDGVLNRKAAKAQYVRSWSDFEWLPGAREALKVFGDAGYRIIVVSNQAGVGRGLMTEDDLRAIHDRMKQEAIDAGGRIDAVYYCPHGWSEGCDCRKPNPGLLFQAQREHSLDLSRTRFVGDDSRDREAADRAGCPFEAVDETTSFLDIARRISITNEQEQPTEAH